MENTGQMNRQELKIQGLIDRYLASRSLNETPPPDQHLDEDSLTAFSEGRLTEREAKPMVAHLVACTFCRHVTAELVRLDMQFAADSEPARAPAKAAEPSKISEVLNGLLSKIFGTSDGAVFAHSEEEKDEKKKDESGEEKDK